MNTLRNPLVALFQYQEAIFLLFNQLKISISEPNLNSKWFLECTFHIANKQFELIFLLDYYSEQSRLYWNALCSSSVH